MTAMKPHPIFSIIMPSLNQRRFIERAIDSVLVHDDVDLELIVMDGGSTDGTLEVLKKVGDPRLRFTSSPDRGQADAINRGFAQARGEVLAWLNSDDEYIPGALSHVADIFQHDPDCFSLYGQVDMVDEFGRVLKRYPTKPWNDKKMARKCYVSQPSVFLRREVVETCGPLLTNLMLCLDYEYWHRVADVYRWRTIDRPLALTRVYSQTKTASRRLRGIVEGCCVSRHYFGQLPLRWSIKYMCRRARLQPKRYFTSPKKLTAWLAIPLVMPRRVSPQAAPRGWTKRFLETLAQGAPQHPPLHAQPRMSAAILPPAPTDHEDSPEVVVVASEPARFV
ncbi:MAG: glycosyltransferase [Phycisphaerales bacterium]|nr:glycosyltransferase [Phycisphaerales bacterium]